MKVTELIEYLSTLPPDNAVSKVSWLIEGIPTCESCTAFQSLMPSGVFNTTRVMACGYWILYPAVYGRDVHTYDDEGPIRYISVPTKDQG